MEQGTRRVTERCGAETNRSQIAGLTSLLEQIGAKSTKASGPRSPVMIPASSSDRAERRVSLNGCEVVVRSDGDVVRVTCPDLPQLDVQDETLSGALYLAEDAIDAILAGTFAKPD